MKFTRTTMLCATMLALLPIGQAQARVTRIKVEKTTPEPAKADPSRPDAPTYETVTGRFYGELDPRDPHNAIITDIAAAPRNALEMVEYSATFSINRPVGGSDVLFYDVPNRGGILRDNEAMGFVRVVSGWQGDLPQDAGLQTARVPVAKGLTGPVLARFVDMPGGTSTLPISGGIGRPPVPHRCRWIPPKPG